MLLLEIVETSRRVAGMSARLEKIEHLAALLRRLVPTDVEIAVGFLSGIPRQGRIGIGWSALSKSMPAAAEHGTLTLELAAPDGRKIAVPPLVLAEVIEGLDEIAEFQVRHEEGGVRIRLVPRHFGRGDGIECKLRSQLAARLAALGAGPTRIQIERVAALERRSSLMGKVKLVQTVSS